MHETKAQQNVQNIKESKCFCKALRVLQILALAALLLLQWECVWVTAEMKWPTFSRSSVYRLCSGGVNAKRGKHSVLLI